MAKELEERARAATAAGEAAARSSVEAEAKVEEVKKALRSEAGGPGGSLAGGAVQVRGSLALACRVLLRGGPSSHGYHPVRFAACCALLSYV